MAEAIGIASSVLAFASAAIKTTRVIVELINGIKDAPEFISDLQSDVQRLRSILLQLETSEKQRIASLNSKPGNKKGKDGTQEADNEYDTIRDQLKHCKTVLKGVEDELVPVLEKMKGNKKQVAWASVCVAFTEKSIKEHSSRLSKAKAELLFTMIIDIRFAVLASSTNIQSPSGPSNAASSSAPPTDDPPPEYPGFDPKVKRRDSNLIREALRNKSMIKRFKSSSGKKGTVEEPDENANESAKQVPTFSQVITSTMDNMSKSVANDTRGDYNISTFKMLWQYDLERIQSLWELETDTVQHLKQTINDHMCKIFISSLSSNITTMDEIKDAAEGTLGWIDTMEEYTRWQGPDDRKVLLLEGKAGSGKSVFTKMVCRIVTQQPEKPESTAPVLLSYFCNKRVRAEESCTQILKAFIYQYFQANKSDFTPVHRLCKSLGDRWDPSEPEKFTFNITNLLDILTTILQISKRPVCCVVDAMDECQRDEDMEGFMDHLPSLLKCNENFRLFMSSRPDWVADNDLSGFNPLKIVLNPDVTKQDIAQVIELELCKIQSKLTIDAKQKHALKKKLINKAEGMILWVVLAFRRIQERIKGMLSPTLKWLERMVEKLPREIFGMYDHIMANIRQKYGKSHHSHANGQVESSCEDEEDEESSNLAVYGKLVLWVARSARPLTVKELQFALALDMKDTCLEDMKKKINCDIERVIGRIPFLEIISAEQSLESDDDEGENRIHGWVPRRASAPSATVRFIHQSAREYILKSADTPENKNLDDDTQFAYPILDDACIGNLCINFLSFKDFDNGPIREFKEPVRFKDGFKKFLEECGFLEYSSTYWAYHFNRASDLNDATKAHVADWICNRKNNIRIWFQVMNFAMFSDWTDFIDGEFGLLAAAGAGIEWLTDYLIAKGHDVSQRDEYGRTPFFLASVRGYEACAKKIADAGGDTSLQMLVRFVGESYELHASICYGTVGNVKDAISEANQEEIEQKDEFGRPPIFYACARGDIELLTTLLELTPAPAIDVKDGYGRLPIDVTLDTECRELVLGKMKKKGMKCSPEMLKKVPCIHNTYNEKKRYLGHILYCNFCGIALHTFYFHCCECSNDEETFEVCGQCHDKGKRCLETEHKLLGRVTGDWLVSSLDYSPHMANAKVVSPIKWTLDDEEEDEEEDDEEDDDTEHSSVSNQRLDPEITLVQTGTQGTTSKKEKETVIVQSVDEKSPGCKCVIL
ncbi:hypothetical protein H072_4227 [Dactylellina haptotyla CBS 200.50]|uniref:Uncharacterized protein n=1 Tax=Dactylellina haptotyla (strain CBS 200.50) TaxID=1284197 RepID=S8ALA4_DACHA|nr:hypothetical protein H072_4227 [Dactylellina haptotyla CBS 200.50]